MRSPTELSLPPLRYVRAVEERPAASFDEDKIDDAVLALLHLNAFREQWGVRAWKSLDWDALDRLHQKGLISDPRSKANHVV